VVAAHRPSHLTAERAGLRRLSGYAGCRESPWCGGIEGGSDGLLSASHEQRHELQCGFPSAASTHLRVLSRHPNAVCHQRCRFARQPTAHVGIATQSTLDGMFAGAAARRAVAATPQPPSMPPTRPRERDYLRVT
jgi:hypothetical protein